MTHFYAVSPAGPGTVTLGELQAIFSQNTLSLLIHNVLRIAIILIVGLSSKYLLSKLVTTILRKKNTQQSHTLVRVFTGAIKYTIYFFMFCAILDLFGISVTSILAVAGVGSIALGFGAQSLVKDVITGIFILSEEQFGIGDYVEIKGKAGRVCSVGLRTTSLKNVVNGEVYIIPNGEISVVTNLTKDNVHRAVVNIEVPFEPDLDTTLRVLSQAVARYDGGEKTLGQPVVQGITDFVESAMNIRILCDCKPGEAWEVERELRRLLKYSMEEENIFIPYATRTVHIVPEPSEKSS